MKSPLVENADYIKDKENYSDIQVLVSGAGYYIGTIYNNPEGYPEPGSRDSVEYYRDKATATTALNNQSWTQRVHP